MAQRVAEAPENLGDVGHEKYVMRSQLVRHTLQFHLVKVLSDFQQELPELDQAQLQEPRQFFRFVVLSICFCIV